MPTGGPEKSQEPPGRPLVARSDYSEGWTGIERSSSSSGARRR